MLLLKGLTVSIKVLYLRENCTENPHSGGTVKILKFGTLQTIYVAIIVLKIEKFHVTLH